MPSPVIAFRAAPALEGQLAARVRTPRLSLNEVARSGLTRYYRVLAAELRRVTLTPAEAALLVDLLRSTHIDDETWPAQAATLLAAELADSAPDGTAARHGVDLDALIAKIRAWGPAQALAVIDAVERFWSDHSEDKEDEGDLTARLVAVGLIRR